MKWSNVSLPFCTEVCKKLILSVIEGVKANLEDGNCFEKFDENNLVVGPSGKVMFKHVRFFPTTYEAKRAMWKNTHDFIESLFGEKTIPKDIEHLLSLINKQTKVLLYTVHPSLESHSERGWCFTKMHEHIKFKITAAQKNMILMKVPYHEKWRTIANQNAVLHETINFIYSNYGRLPKFNEKGVLYTEIEIQLHEAEMFLDFIRHGTANRLQRNISLTPHQHELILLVMYPLLLPLLQEAILDVLGEPEFRKILLRSVLEVTMEDMKLLEMCDGGCYTCSCFQFVRWIMCFFTCFVLSELC
uniref:Uncharacterized protein n=1 Tax=Oryza barthii TaxID=65489 RepID=A0A0D3G351_9ORYZ